MGALVDGILASGGGGVLCVAISVVVVAGAFNARVNRRVVKMLRALRSGK